MKNISISIGKDVAKDMSASILTSAFGYAKLYELLHKQLWRKGRCVLSEVRIANNDKTYGVINYYDLKGDSTLPYDYNDRNRLGLNHLFAGQSPHQNFIGSTDPEDGGIQGDEVRMNYQGNVRELLQKVMVNQEEVYLSNSRFETEDEIRISLGYKYYSDGTLRIASTEVATDGVLVKLNNYAFKYDESVHEVMPYVTSQEERLYPNYRYVKSQSVVASTYEDGDGGTSYSYFSILNQYELLRQCVLKHGQRVKAQTEEEELNDNIGIVATNHKYGASVSVEKIYIGRFSNTIKQMSYWIFADGNAYSFNVGHYYKTVESDGEGGSYERVHVSNGMLRSHILVDLSNGRTVLNMIEFVDNYNNLFKIHVKVDDDLPWWKEVLVIVVSVVVAYFTVGTGLAVMGAFIGAIGIITGDGFMKAIGSLFSIAGAVQQGFQNAATQEALNAGASQSVAEAAGATALQEASFSSLVSFAFTDMAFDTFMGAMSVFSSLNGSITQTQTAQEEREEDEMMKATSLNEEEYGEEFWRIAISDRKLDKWCVKTNVGDEYVELGY